MPVLGSQTGRGESVFILRRAARNDRHGDPTVPQEPLEVPGCIWWPRSAAEETFQRDTVREGITVMMPAGTSVLPTDRIEVRGVEYAVLGEPEVFDNPFATRSSCVVVNLTRSGG